MLNEHEDEYENETDEENAPPITPSISRKRKSEGNDYITPPNKTSKKKTPVAPKKKARKSTDGDDDNKIENIGEVNENTVIDFALYRNGTIMEKPKFSIGAMIKLYFLKESKFNSATSKDLFAWFMDMHGYKSMGKKQLRQSITSVFSVNDNVFEKIQKAVGTFRLIGSSKPSPPSDSTFYPPSQESRRYTKNDETTKYAVTWNPSGTTFELLGYRWYEQKKSGGIYANCISCKELRKRMTPAAWELVKRHPNKPNICGLKFTVEKEEVMGCPWAPNGTYHICLKKLEIEALLKKEQIEERKAKTDEKIKELIQSISEKLKGETDSHGFEFGTELTALLADEEEIQPYGEGEKLYFLYYIYKDGELKYVGMTCNFDQRSYDHPYGEYSILFEGDGTIEFVIAPIGKRNESFIADLEASYIQLSKKGAFGAKVSLLNEDNGRFQSKDHVLKEVIEDEDHPRRPALIIALKELLECSLNHGARVTLYGISDARKLSKAKKTQANNQKKLDKIEPPPMLSSTQSTTTSSQNSSHSSQSLSLIPSRMKQLKEFIEENSARHIYHQNQKEYYFYILKKPGTNTIVYRYGITDTPAKRNKEHKNTFDKTKKFEMLVAELGPQNLRFIKDIEASCIRIAKKHPGKFDKQNCNNERDYGFFSSDYGILEEAAEKKNHPRHKYLKKAMEQLIELILERGRKIV